MMEVKSIVEALWLKKDVDLDKIQQNNCTEGVAPSSQTFKLGN
jgi:hypothetical protein